MSERAQGAVDKHGVYVCPGKQKHKNVLLSIKSHILIYCSHQEEEVARILMHQMRLFELIDFCRQFDDERQQV